MEVQRQIPSGTMSAAARQKYANDYARVRHDEVWRTIGVIFARWDMIGFMYMEFDYTNCYCPLGCCRFGDDPFMQIARPHRDRAVFLG